VKKLAAYKIDTGDLNSANITCTALTCEYGTVYGNMLEGLNLDTNDAIISDSLEYKNYDVTWKSESFQTFVLSATRNFNYGTAGGYVTGQIITGSINHTIHYLGRD